MNKEIKHKTVYLPDETINDIIDKLILNDELVLYRLGKMTIGRRKSPSVKTGRMVKNTTVYFKQAPYLRKRLK